MKKWAVGLMSGTSADGVSLTLTSFRGQSFQLLSYKTYPYPKSLNKQLRQGSRLTTRGISQLNVTLGQFFAKTTLKFIKKTRSPLSKISVIGSHGQTLYHGPDDHPAHTLQLGEPCLIAEHTGIPVVADFRMRDLAAGGEGAPLIPFFDQYFFGRNRVRAMQNIGGIANVTVVGKRVVPLAFDTGPGNCLIDWAVRKITQNHLSFDPSGKIARRGRVDMRTVRQMAEHTYFKNKPPKSTGLELFNESFLPRSIVNDHSENLVATLTYFTAYTIRESYRIFIPYKISEIIVSGGGALNDTLMAHLSNLFWPIPVRSIEPWGIPAQSKEPIAFSFLALRALEGKINHLPHTTGARHACILGKIIPGKIRYANG